MVTRRHGIELVATLALLVAVCAGCGGVDPAAQSLAENGSDVSDVTARVSGLAASFAVGAGATLDLAAVAEAGALYAPEGCVTTETGSDSVTLTFKGCSGPWGLGNIDGSVTVGPPPGGPTPYLFEINTTHLKVDGATVVFDAEAMVRATGSTRVLTWSPALSGTTARGSSFQSEGDWTLTWTLGGTCILGASDGDQASVSGSSLFLSVTGLERCNTDCATAGTLVVSDGTLSDTISFNGMDVAPFTTKSGTNDILLACGL